MSAAHRDEIAKLESLYAENPEGRVFTHLAEAYRKAGELDRAREILSTGIERHPDYSSAHVVLGRVLMDQGEGQEADAAFQRVLELDPHNLIAMRSRADIARERGDNETAIDLYSRLLDQEPGDDQVREILEDMSQPAGESAVEPVDAFTSRRLDEDGDDAELRTETIAQVYARQGLYDRAAEVYRELSRDRPDDDSLRERLAEMEQLAEAQTDASEEVEAVSDFDAPSQSPAEAEETEEAAEAEEAPWEEAPWDEAAWSEPDQPAEEESPWSPSAPVEAEDDESPWEQTSQADVFRVEGLESSEVDTSEGEADQLADIEVDETDPETGLRTGATPDVAAPEEDLSEEMDVRDVPEPPSERPWEAESGEEDEPSWLSGVGTPETDAPADSEAGAAESVWSGADWEGETDVETTPHAWTEEDDGEADASPPVREYFSGLLGWSGAQPGPEHGTSAATGAHDLPGASDSSGADLRGASDSSGADLRGASDSSDASDLSGGSEAGGGSEPRHRSGSAERGEDDDDLDMFRSWLESLKQ